MNRDACQGSSGIDDAEVAQPRFRSLSFADASTAGLILLANANPVRGI